MKVWQQADVDAYAADDYVARMLDEAAVDGDEAFASHRWLVESLPKRAIYADLYGDLIGGPQWRERMDWRRIADIGGGFCALTRRLARRNGYDLIDIMAHDDHDALRVVEMVLPGEFWVPRDWRDVCAVKTYDIVICNDLFPNVDQRLDLFLAAWLPRCREMRLSLAYYQTPRAYAARRLDGDEVLHVVAWDGERTRRALSPHEGRIESPDLDALLTDGASLFANGRQVCTVRMRGDL